MTSKKDDGPANPSPLSKSVGVEPQITTGGGIVPVGALMLKSEE
jgi:hypothetical protein